MMKLVICILLSGLITIQMGVEVNSDPAPGRSPGPPTTNTDPNSFPIDLNAESINEKFESNSNFDDSNLRNKEDSVTYLEPMKESNQKTNEQKIPCHQHRNAFLNGGIIRDNQSDERATPRLVEVNEIPPTTTTHPNDIDIQLNLEHGIYDVSQGINCGVMYKVRLIIHNPSVEKENSESAGQFFVEAFSSLNGYERGSFVNHSLGNMLPLSWFNTLRQNANWMSSDGDFILLSGIMKNIFSSSSEENNGDDLSGENSKVTAEVNNSGEPPTLSEHDGGGGGGETYTNNIFFNKNRTNVGKNTTKCTDDNVWQGNGKYKKKIEYLNLWMLNEICDHDDTIQFRVYFRALSDQHQSTKNSSADRDKISPPTPLIYKRTFSFKLVKDCQLVLKEQTGLLDYSALPLYTIDCTINFPSYKLTNSVSSSSSTTNMKTILTTPPPPPGILVKLTRLNVPCNSGGYLKFNDRNSLCGKLEELSEAERTYHFDVLGNTSVRIFKNPMFSFNYKLVDYCYNVTTSNRSGEFYIQSSFRDSLECFFRIHLPYGNRVQLKLVTNNDSDIILANNDKFANIASANNDDDNRDDGDDDEILAIYTTLGVSIETQIVNLSSMAMEYPYSDNHVNISDSTSTTTTKVNGDAFYSNLETKENFLSDRIPATTKCRGIMMKIFENELSKWSYCVNSSNKTRGFVIESTKNVLNIYLHRSNVMFGISRESKLPSVYLAYSAKSVPEIVSHCAFGWIALQQFCVSAIETLQTWFEGEEQCVNLGGHLASIRTELHQSIINKLLLYSPGYQDRFSYWVGGSDKNFEGDFRWSDGLPFQYTNWFPGWSQHSHYNKQPNDDGLSSQDCIELRRYFRSPPGTQLSENPFTNNFMWNDRNCNAKNFIICERAMSEESVRRNWFDDCNKTVSLTKEHPRASIWSPSFPRQYPDNANCFTTITAPSDYRIVIEFEELVIENEPGCTYDYLEITEPYHAGQKGDTKSLKFSKQQHKNQSNNNSNNSESNFRKRNFHEILNVNSNSYNNLNIAQNNYKNLLNIFSNLYKPHTNFLIQTPDYPKGNPLYRISNFSPDQKLPKRLCGDWSSKLKLLRYVSTGPYVGMHFVSDYSHHFGGYKAKAYMENTASECANERLRPYNGSCYLFVSYPEADWWTAQQVCRGMGAKLSSVTSSDEHRFITTNIRNQIDYSPQLVYWLGGQLEKSGKFEWTDGTKMNFQGWLPGQGHFDILPTSSTCLGLQWKMSPTPMLPSGLYWQSQRCNQMGGYVCKKPKESYTKFAFSNFTMTGTEGRLLSPAYPSSYPLNIDYWIHIKAPEKMRIIVQFQKIELEPQDECLYDFVSLQNYELISKILLEPGTNPVPMAMLNWEQTAYDNDDLLHRNGKNLQFTSRRDISSIAGRSQFSGNRIRRSLSQTMGCRNRSDSCHIVIKSLNTKVERLKLMLNMKHKRRKKVRQKIDFVKGKAGRRQKRQTQINPSSDNAQSFLPYVRWCGFHDSNMSKFDFVSSSNEIMLNFHSDYSITGLGFAAIWKAIDISGCPLQTLTSREGIVASPNYPHFMLNNLNCAYVIQAPTDRRVWLEFIEYDLLIDSFIEVDLGNGSFRPFRLANHVNEGVFVSSREKLKIQYRTGQHPRGRGFQAIFHTVDRSKRERIINLTNNISGHLFHLNYPQKMPENIDFVQHLVAPFGNNILLELHGVEFTSESACPDDSMLDVYDNYADYNGTKWQLCKYQNNHRKGTEGGHFSSENIDGEYFMNMSTENAAPIYITSYFNTLHIRQKTNSKPEINLNGTVRIQLDNNYKLKLASGDKFVESCNPNPCQFNGKCINKNGLSFCQCHGHYTGRFCGLTLCELEPCIFGKCELTATHFKCQCQPGYIGKTCEHKQRPCADNPCEGRGICLEKNGEFLCRCHAWWEGHRCERRMLHIPYKPLSERMLQEPFWLGLITVFVVLAVIGLVWCAKRHFPEKIEKLLAEEADRNRPPGSLHGHHHHTSLREQLQFTTTIPQPTTTGNIVTGGGAPQPPRSIFNRLGIRKPSLLSLSSPNSTAVVGETARTFSLDDLLQLPPRRSPSPHKKRNNSTPVKKNVTEKKQILQQLVSSAAVHPKPKPNLTELIHMTDQHQLRTTAVTDSENDIKETAFSEKSLATATTIPNINKGASLVDPKLEKKVTFARLLNKVSAEMNSGSDLDNGGVSYSSALSLPTDIQLRASSMPPTPCANDMRSTQESEDFCGSDSSFQSFNRNRAGCTKVSSADSIFAIFRNFTTANAAASQSTTPTLNSSPQEDDEICGEDEGTSTSSIHTPPPVSFSSGGGGAPDSPIFHRQKTSIVDVPADVVNSSLSSLSTSIAEVTSSVVNSSLLHPPTILLELPSNGINKCLSPIREMPTPMPSPALTPIMPRAQRSNSSLYEDYPLLSPTFSGDYDNEDDVDIDYDDDEDDDDDDDDEDDGDENQSSDAQLSEKLLKDVDETKSQMQTKKYESPPSVSQDSGKSHQLRLTQTVSSAAELSATAAASLVLTTESGDAPGEKASRPRNLIIPKLIIEQPSPTKTRYPMINFAGSPPPQRASIGETSFMFPNKQQQKRLLKHFDKPTSLDLPFEPPMITITSNMSEMESDTEPLSPHAQAQKANASSSLLAPNQTVAMNYLSPFTICSRPDHTISESNLSSSGYSSMASPGPSRCGSSNPLFSNEMDEPGSGHFGATAGFSLHVNLLNRRKNSALTSCKENITNGKESGGMTDGHKSQDSETFSDDILLESNDEGISTDHIEERDGKESRAKVMLGPSVEKQIAVEVEVPLTSATTITISQSVAAAQMDQLQLPSILFQVDGIDKSLSPVSSRSESPLSERTSMERFSPHFYGRKDLLPFTDSDGLYDFPSSDGKGISSPHYTHQRRSSKKRERKSSKTSQTQSPTRNQLELPSGKESANTTTPTSHICSKHCHSSHHHSCPMMAIATRKSPKRRPINRHSPIASSSSSSESLMSTREYTLRRLPRRLNSPSREKHHLNKQQESSSDKEQTNTSTNIANNEDRTISKTKINRLRAIGNQIRFLRRLERCIKTKELLVSPSDSCADDNTDDLDSPQATSPLLTSQTPNSLCRQKRMLGSSRKFTTLTTTTNASKANNWKNVERTSIIDDNLNSD